MRKGDNLKLSYILSYLIVYSMEIDFLLSKFPTFTVFNRSKLLKLLNDGRTIHILSLLLKLDLLKLKYELFNLHAMVPT